MRTVMAVVACLLMTACGVSTQDDPEPLGTPTMSGEAPTPVVTQRPHHSTPTSSSSTPATSTAPTPTP
jgi:hypothetical protein